MTSDKFQKPQEIPPLKKTKYDSPVTKYVFVKKNPLYLKIEKKLEKLFRFTTKRKKYGHNPNLIKRDEEIVIDYNVLRQEDVIPGECLRSLALEYELSPATIDDIVKGKTKRKKKIGVIFTPKPTWAY